MLISTKHNSVVMGRVPIGKRHIERFVARNDCNGFIISERAIHKSVTKPIFIINCFHPCRTALVATRIELNRLKIYVVSI